MLHFEFESALPFDPTHEGIVELSWNRSGFQLVELAVVIDPAPRHGLKLVASSSSVS